MGRRPEAPPGQREAVLHRYVDDLPYREIGRILGCSEAAARQRVRAGLRTLRRDGEDLR
ncbi:MAG: sigma-70 region 4 domain-containing protein [Acidimicrobiia bacterium]|nr:sigma-70 region 4 domain-containing protein [Acidimicrobiia bacterium]